MSTTLTFQAEVVELKKQIVSRDEDIKSLREKIRLLEMRLFGSRSEKGSMVSSDAQGELFVLDEDEEVEPGIDENQEPQESPMTRRRKGNAGRKPLPANLPRIEKVVDLSPEEKICCGQEMKHIGNDEREVLECLPAIFFVIRYLIPKYTCEICKGENCCHGTIATAETPTRMLAGSSAGNSVVAEVVANKMADGLPGYRQTRRFERFGLSLSRRTITNWLINVAKKCHVLDKYLLEDALSTGSVQMDETFVQVLREEGRNNRTKSYMWVLRSVPADCPIVYFKYHPTRASAVPRAMLADYSGMVQTDGYKGYDYLEQLESVTLIACWAHVRRKFSDIIKASSKKRKKQSLPEEALAIMRRLYAVEKKARENQLSPSEILNLRTRESKPVLDEFKAWLEKYMAEVPPGSALGKAIHYALRLWPRLIRYADSGIAAIDNNSIENAIRPFVVGRKAWLFAGSPEGADCMATLYSLVETAKANDWEPYAYLRFLFDHLPNAVFEEEKRNLLPHRAKPISMSSYLDEERMKFLEQLTSLQPQV